MEVKSVSGSFCSAKYTPLENKTSAMAIKNINKQNSWIEALNVFPRTCRPTECLLNLNILNTRTKRIIRSTEKDTDEDGTIDCTDSVCVKLILQKNFFTIFFRK